MAITAYPLCWPAGRPRAARPENSRFNTALSQTINKLLAELALLGARDVIISSNVPVRRDGLPYATHAKPSDAGVAVYFSFQGRQTCLACDRWRLVGDNLHAIALTIQALRGISRWGSGDMVEAAFTGFAALPSPDMARSWRDVLREPGEPAPETLSAATALYRHLARERHPDMAGGSNEAMSELNRAYDAARAELR